jgi:putative nucleotidyltransferase-like protein
MGFGRVHLAAKRYLNADMHITGSTGGCWPTPIQELLLKATLLKTEAALQAWQEWFAQGRLDRLDIGSFHLLPMTYRNLRSLGYRDPVLMRLRGVNRRAWCENHLLFRRVASVLAMFHNAGISTLLLKGAALTLLYYHDFAVRPMQDLDILVPEERALDAVALLETQGWSRNTLPAVRLGRFFLSYRHSAEFTRQPQERFDLHWHVLFQACYREADRPFWEASVPVMVEGISTRALCATDQLLHVCVHGVAWNNTPPLRWVADASCILESSAIDWQRLLLIAASCRVIPSLRDGLRYLVNTVEAPVPNEVMQKLESMPVTSSEELEYLFHLQQLGSLGVTHSVRALYSQYRRTMRGKSPLERVVGIPIFLQHYWGLDRPWRTIARTFNYARKRIGLP